MAWRRVPGANLGQALDLLYTYDRHAEIFSLAIACSKLVSRSDDVFRVDLRFYMKKVITVVVNTKNEARFTRLESDRAPSRIYNLRVAEVADPGTPQGRERPVGGWRISLAAPYLLEVSRARFRHSSLVERTNRSAGITILRPHRRQDHPDTLASVEPDHCPAPLQGRDRRSADDRVAAL